MKKVTLALLALVFCTILFTSCSNKPDPVTPKTASFYVVNKYSTSSQYILYNLQSGYVDKNRQNILIESYGDVDNNLRTKDVTVDYNLTGGQVYLYFRDLNNKLWRVGPMTIEAGKNTALFISDGTQKTEVTKNDLPNSL